LCSFRKALSSLERNKKAAAAQRRRNAGTELEPGKMMAVGTYILLAAVALVTVYLFYAVIHPERF
jgi:type VI protein secretion system component VasF